MALIHGGDTEGYRLEYGHAPLDFSTNCNPLGVPEGVQQAIHDAVVYADAYSDPLCRHLCAAIAKNRDILPPQVLCGNGAADLIYRLALARKPGRAIVTAPTFAEYELALKTIGCKVIQHLLKPEDGFILTDSILACLNPGTDMLFLCNPNNPTGLTTDSMLLERILIACERNGILLVVDECFNGFLKEPEKHTFKNKLSQYENLLIIDAFTKLYGMAGVRLGYCLSSNKMLLDDMRNAGQPWAVSSLAQAAGIAALEERKYILKARTLIEKEKIFLLNQLQALDDIKVFGSEANYIFFHIGIPHLIEHLRDKGILIRDCSNYAGLTSGYYRIAIRTHPENVRLMNALSTWAGQRKD